MKKKDLKVLDLFCGAGGLSEGFRRAGYEIVAGIDNDAEALVTHHANFPSSTTLSHDLGQDLSSNSGLMEGWKKKGVNILIGGPPCQGLSIAGKRLAADPRNKLYKAYLGIIRKLKPEALLLENVPTILSLHGGAVASAVRKDFEELGYKTSVFVLNAADYGVPQIRKRAFFVGLKSKGTFKIPAPTTPFKPVTTEEALSDLPLLENESGGDELKYTASAKTDYQELMRKNSRSLFNHWVVEHKEQTKKIIRLVPDGGNYKNLPKHLQNTRRVNIAWTRMNSRKPCFTIDAGHNHHFHYKANRVPTVRECARIQSFPDHFKFLGKKTSQFRQVGNAVPPLLAEAIARSLREAV